MVFPFCYRCKGTRDLCELGRCPLLDEVRAKVQPVTVSGGSVEGPSPPSVFVGSFGYPKLTMGPLATPLPIPLPERLEKSEYLFDRTIGDVYSIRSSLVRGKYKLDVKAVRGPAASGSDPLFEIEPGLPLKGRKLLGSVQELALSSRSLDTEMRFTKDLRGLETSAVDSITMPMGPSADLRSLTLHGNAAVPNKVEVASSDIDARASDIARELYDNGIPIDHLVRLFSVGLLGEGRRRKLVPTRWSITALDDTLSLQIKERIMELPSLDTYQLYHGERFGNHFLIAFFPPPFRFEMLEQWQRGSLWGSGEIAMDHEGPMGRKDYASEITGAYYAARLSALEHLERIGRCGGVSVLRWITKEYWAPLGVWVIRETVKRALQGIPEEFEDMNGLIQAIRSGCAMQGWEDRTVLLTGKEDTSLDRFLQ